MRVLVLGSGGREHALLHALRRSPSVADLYCVPGNGGTLSPAAAALFDPMDLTALLRFVRQHGIDLVVPGSESFIAAGVADALAAADPPVAVFAPTRSAGRLETSKLYGSEFRRRHGIPSPRALFPETFEDACRAAEQLIGESGGVAVKADGLCAGKGVVVARDLETARSALREMLLESRFGEAGARVVLEELVEGEEVSVMALTDGRHALPLLPAQDYKRLLDGNRGPNTGGMGSYAPVPWMDAPMLESIQRDVLDPTVAGLQAEGIDYCGVIYAGLILGPRGPLVLEYNARFGDPETEAVLPLLQSDLGELLSSCCRRELPKSPLSWKPGAAVCVILASEGYPAKPRTGDPIEGLLQAENAGAVVFHAGTRRDGDVVRTAGGRVLGITALGADLFEAADQAHAAADQIRFPGLQRRRDIGRIGNGPGSPPLGCGQTHQDLI